jgi:AcrR family transcriptional regulator
MRSQPTADSRHAVGIQPLDGRSQRSLRTRRAIQQAALELFATYGYEATTVAQIAARAKVSDRSFFVHFSTKEDVLFNGPRTEIDTLDRLVEQAPAHLSDLAAVEHALLQVHQQNPPSPLDRKMTGLLVRAAVTSPLVRGKQMEYGDRLAAAAAKGLARRRHERRPSQAAVTIAEVALKIHHLAVIEWTNAAAEDLNTIFARRLKLLRDLARDPSQF